MRAKYLLLLTLIAQVTIHISPISSTVTPPDPTLVQPEDFHYVGAGRSVASTNDGDPVDCNTCFPNHDIGNGFTLNFTKNGFFLSNLFRYLMEESLPVLVNSNNLTDLNRAVRIQAPNFPYTGATIKIDGDPLPGHGGICGGYIDGGGCSISGVVLRPATNDLLALVGTPYDGSNNQSWDVYVVTSDLSGSSRGAFKLGLESFSSSTAGPVSGGSGSIPVEWRPFFGNHDTFSFMCCTSVISRTSLGPSLTVYTAADVGVTNPINSTMVLGYPETHATLGPYGGPGTVGFDNSTRIPSGAVWIGSSVLFFGRRGTIGNQVYGPGTTNSAKGAFPPDLCNVYSLANPNPCPPPGNQCSGFPVDTQGDSCNTPPAIPGPSGNFVDAHACDPLACTLAGPLGTFKWALEPNGDGSEGDHGWPYITYVYAYNASCLADVYAGIKHYWDCTPYRYWQLKDMNGGVDVPFVTSGYPYPVGTTVDIDNKMLYHAMTGADFSASPVILGFGWTKNFTIPQPSLYTQVKNWIWAKFRNGRNPVNHFFEKPQLLRKR